MKNIRFTLNLPVYLVEVDLFRRNPSKLKHYINICSDSGSVSYNWFRNGKYHKSVNNARNRWCSIKRMFLRLQLFTKSKKLF